MKNMFTYIYMWIVCVSMCARVALCVQVHINLDSDVTINK